MGVETIPPPLQPEPLRCAHFTLPDYRYVPGLQAHPWRSESGHHHTDRLSKMEPMWWEGVDWCSHDWFLHGCDLFDHRYLWEAHEVWEEIWHAVPKGDPDRERIQLLIQAAACALKVHMGSISPARSLLERCRQRLEHVEEGLVDCVRLLVDLERFIDGGEWPRLYGLEGTPKD